MKKPLKPPKTTRVKLATFTASEIEQITGASPALLRDWRRRGLIDPKPGSGWARLGTDDLIQILVMRVLSARNIASGFARSLGRMAIIHVLKALGTEAFPDRAIEYKTRAGSLLFLGMIGDDPAAEVEKGGIPTGTVWANNGPNVPVQEFLVYAEQHNSAGEHQGSILRVVSSVESFIAEQEKFRLERGEEHPRRFFALIVLSLQDIYDELIDRRIKPYFDLHNGGQADGS
jgi:hypothetical protein